MMIMILKMMQQNFWIKHILKVVLGDTMILTMSNFLCTPIIIFSTLQNSILPVIPRMVVGETLISVAYNHTGSGHYDAVISKQISKKDG